MLINNIILLYYFVIIIINYYTLIYIMDSLLVFNLGENNESLPENSEEGSFTISVVPLTKYDRFIRWFYWKVFGIYVTKFNSYKEFKTKRDPWC